MGAGQSAPRGSNSPDVGRNTCYYELLGVEPDVTDEEIRRAYKKKALELHPDRNFNDTENATRRFAEVQTAYEILSDPQERAWYDSHRDAILNGENDVAGTAPTDPSGASHTSANAIFALMSRFNSGVPMDDSPKGFFGVLNELFDQLAAEEIAACDWTGLAPTEYPTFGKADDSYNAVAKQFYQAWSGFSTKKSFSWRDKYRLQDAPDRRVRRLMEKENKKFREEGIREFNDSVQSLIAFVKKRDPRYVPNTQSESERQQVLRDSAAAQASRSRAANQEKLAEYVVPDWVQSRDDAEDNDEFSMSEEEEEVEEIQCVVCNKTFKSEKQFEAHEKSKKHNKAVQQLQRQMRKENQNLDLGGASPNFPSPSTRAEDSEDSEEGGGSDKLPNDNVTHETRLAEKDVVADSSGHPQTGSSDSLSHSDTEENDEYAPRSAVEARIMDGGARDMGGANVGNIPDAVDSLTPALDGLNLDGREVETKKMGKAKLKREKKAAQRAAEADVLNAVSFLHKAKKIILLRDAESDTRH
ncbi:hypothetical protein B0J18DRAFT_469867 [Chaetomium sp. MPI-SDFR-AT-0129]|nr:hypothetical protein B0J18DRAFT_469867 [Chaetomium sp. MPI-SDFR-AT-0129]